MNADQCSDTHCTNRFIEHWYECLAVFKHRGKCYQHQLLNCLIADYEVVYFLARRSRGSDMHLTGELL